MKRNNLYLIFYCLCVTAISCSKKNIKDPDGDLLTSQVEKIETFLAEGATKENITDPNVPKIETRASEEAMKKIYAQLRQEVDDSYKKTRVMGTLGAANNPHAFAVFKSGSCFGYTPLSIKMDCEDRRPASSKTGWTGESWVDNGDVWLEFCIIDDDYSRYMGVGDSYVQNPISERPYGFLYLGETIYFQTDPNQYPYPQGWRNYFYPLYSQIRVFDNEDGNNNNAVYVGGQQQPLTFWLGPSAHSQASYVAGNTRLHWIVVPGNPNGNPYARNTLPGFSEYCLLGAFGNEMGGINVDDEDTNNQNAFEVGGYYNHTDAAGNGVSNPFPYAQTIEGGNNTYLHFSKVGN